MARHKLTALSLMLVSMAPVLPAMADPLVLDDNAYSDDRLAPGIYPAAPVPQDFAVPSEPGRSPFDIDWSVGLKGSYTTSSDGNSFVTTLKPAFSATRAGGRTDLTVSGSADLARSGAGAWGVTAVTLDGSSTTALGHDTTLTGTANLGLSRDLPGLPGSNSLVTDPPVTVTGSLGAGVTQEFGRFNLGLKGALTRTAYGPTTRSDIGVSDNSSQNVWSGETTLRLGLRATPILEIFGEAGLGRDWYDGTGSSGFKGDATSRILRVGVSARWNETLSANASVGLAQHDFDEAGLADFTTRLYDASVTYSPDPTLNLTAALSTAVEPIGTDGNGTARVVHRAAANVDYGVNDWLRLRASADWSQSWLEGGTESERRHGLGAGADYKLSTHTALSADYGYSHRDNSVSGLLDAHTVSLGVTVKR